MVFLFLLTFICILFLFILKLNRGQEIQRLLYEHKFIPTSLGKYVNINFS
ncbi:hypothetical protein [Diatraea saccharalis granulovirus]|uniref:PIF-7 n=1 Tax=Diatraea saccharalis granulovirus TaxID=1675862 RepID=A0A0R7EZ02_9BBAC|nr:hypothetical protein [Diatraea saccharalis granulovirus]AKN80723.1 hypothetical protein [Diatraea saccharalis granulovirus]